MRTYTNHTENKSQSKHKQWINSVTAPPQKERVRDRVSVNPIFYVCKLHVCKVAPPRGSMVEKAR